MYLPQAYKEEFLEQQDGHKVYYAQYGNQDGQVIVSFHGGPGSQGKPKHTDRFDLQKYRVITIDQRGCGKSEFKDLLHENNTDKLIEDVERIREVLKIDKWYVCGGSWGSTLALLYAGKYPDRVRGLMLSSIYLADSKNERWSFSTGGGIGQMFPDVWEKRVELLSEIGVSDGEIAKGLYKKLIDDDINIVKKAAAVVESWEGNLLTANKEVSYVRPEELEDNDIKSAKIFLHYEANDFFMKDDQIINGVKYIENIPTVIVHGRYDLICPYEQAWRLHKSLKNSVLITLPQSNHFLTIDGEVARKLAFESFLKDFNAVG